MDNTTIFPTINTSLINKPFLLEFKQLKEYYNFHLEFQKLREDPNQIGKFERQNYFLIDKAWLNKWKEFVGYNEFSQKFIKNREINEGDYMTFQLFISQKKQENKLFPLDNSNIYLSNGVINSLAEFVIINRKCYEAFGESRQNMNYKINEKVCPLLFSINKIILTVSDNSRIIYFKNDKGTEEEILIIFTNTKNKNKILEEIDKADNFNYWLKDRNFNLNSIDEMDLKDDGYKIINKKLKLKNPLFKNSISPKTINSNTTLIGFNYNLSEEIKAEMLSQVQENYSKTLAHLNQNNIFAQKDNSKNENNNQQFTPNNAVPKNTQMNYNQNINQNFQNTPTGNPFNTNNNANQMNFNNMNMNNMNNMNRNNVNFMNNPNMNYSNNNINCFNNNLNNNCFNNNMNNNCFNNNNNMNFMNMNSMNNMNNMNNNMYPQNNFGQNRMNMMNNQMVTNQPNMMMIGQMQMNNNNQYNNNMMNLPSTPNLKNSLNLNLSNQNSSQDFNMQKNGTKIDKGKTNIQYSPFTNGIIFPHKAGLVNVGQSCYMNATIECLSNIERLTEKLLRKYGSYDVDKQPLCVSYSSLLCELFHTRGDFIEPRLFKEIIGKLNPLFEGNHAADAKDLIFFLIETLHKELLPQTNNVNNNNEIDFLQQEKNAQNEGKMLDEFLKEYKNNYTIISDLFYGMNRSIMTCNNCHITKYSFQTFNLLIFPLKKVKDYKIKKLGGYNTNLNLDLYDAFYCEQEPEKLEGENMIYCNNCRQLTPGFHQQQIYGMPQILIIILNRGKNNQDFNEEFKFDEYLDFSSSNIIVNNKKESYKKFFLCGVITHLGESGAGGHFIAYCRNNNDEHFTCYNDASVSQASVIDAMSAKISARDIEKKTPYILLYQKY